MTMSVSIPLLFYSYLAEQCWRGGCISFIMLRHVKQKAPPPPPCSLIGSVIVPVSSGDEQDHRNHTDVLQHSTFPCNWKSKESELQSCSSLYNSSLSLDSCETSGPSLTSHTVTNQNPDNFCKDATVCLRHSHTLESQINSFSHETSNQV